MNLVINPSHIADCFDCIANDLFNNYIIKVNENLYRLLEIEFYYNDGQKHIDLYTHGHNWQKRSVYWYVHGSGIDITFGSENIYGGILLRSIEKIAPLPKDAKEKYFFGPLNVLTELVSGFNNPFDGDANDFKLIPSLDRIQKVPIEEIVQCERIGLSSKNEDKDSKYQKAQYRYLIYPHLKHKEKTKIALALKEKWKDHENVLDKIKKLLGSEFLKAFR